MLSCLVWFWGSILLCSLGWQWIRYACNPGWLGTSRALCPRFSANSIVWERRSSLSLGKLMTERNDLWKSRFHIQGLEMCYFLRGMRFLSVCFHIFFYLYFLVFVPPGNLLTKPFVPCKHSLMIVWYLCTWLPWYKLGTRCTLDP